MAVVVYDLFTTPHPKQFVYSSLFVQACIIEAVFIIMFCGYILLASAVNAEFAKHRCVGSSLSPMVGLAVTVDVILCTCCDDV